MEFYTDPSKEERAKGFVGYNLDVFKANAWRDYRTENGKQMGFFRKGLHKRSDTKGAIVINQNCIVFTIYSTHSVYYLCFVNHSSHTITGTAAYSPCSFPP